MRYLQFLALYLCIIRKTLGRQIGLDLTRGLQESTSDVIVDIDDLEQIRDQD